MNRMYADYHRSTWTDGCIQRPPDRSRSHNPRRVDQVCVKGASINNYNVTLNIGQHRHFRDWHECGGRFLIPGLLSCPMTWPRRRCNSSRSGDARCCEAHLGPIHSRKTDSSWFNLHPGMGTSETAIVYGNHFENGYRGRSQSAEGKWFDYIIIHESAHEWFWK